MLTGCDPPTSSSRLLAIRLTSPDRNLFLEDGSSGDDWDVEQVTTITDASEVMAKWESISPRCV